jgi:hypothetical protein
MSFIVHILLPTQIKKRSSIHYQFRVNFIPHSETWRLCVPISKHRVRWSQCIRFCILAFFKSARTIVCMNEARGRRKSWSILRYFPSICMVRTRKSINIRIAGFWAKIWTRGLSHTNLSDSDEWCVRLLEGIDRKDKSENKYGESKYKTQLRPHTHISKNKNGNFDYYF